MTFYVGQKVVCVDASGAIDPRPVKGRVYTIDSVAWIDDANGNDGWGATLVELPTIETDDHYAEFFAWRFRPIVERKTDISIFTKMLSSEKIRA